MKLNALMPVLYTENIQATIEFYTGHLGFQCKNYNEDYSWALIANNEVEIMLSKPNEHTSFDNPVFTGSFYFRTDAVDELWDAVKSKSRICYPIENFEYGMREFAIYDNNGYLLQFGCEIKDP